MALKFRCRTCGKDIVIRFLKVGEAAECKNCGASNPVPESAESADDETVLSYQSSARRSTESIQGEGTQPPTSANAVSPMLRRIWLFGLVLVVPVIGFAVAEGIQAHFNSELRSVLRAKFVDADPIVISAASMDRICAERTTDLGDICDINDNLHLMSAASLSVGAVGVILLVAIRLAGSLSRTNRRLLLFVFKPGLYLTAVALIVVVLVHASIAMAAIYYGESALIGRIHVGIIAMIGLGALGGVIAISRNVFSLVSKARTIAIGKAVSRTEAPALWQRVDQISDRLGALHPENIVLGLDPNFFVTEARLHVFRESSREGQCTARFL